LRSIHGRAFGYGKKKGFSNVIGCIDMIAAAQLAKEHQTAASPVTMKPQTIVCNSRRITRVFFSRRYSDSH